MANFNFNLMILGGRCVETPELKSTKTGTTYCAFSVAVNMPRSCIAYRSDYIKCHAYGETAEFISSNFVKGSSICITGEYATHIWTDKQNHKHYDPYCLVKNVNFVDAKADVPFDIPNAECAETENDEQ